MWFKISSISHSLIRIVIRVIFRGGRHYPIFIGAVYSSQVITELFHDLAIYSLFFSQLKKGLRLKQSLNTDSKEKNYTTITTITTIITGTFLFMCLLTPHVDGYFWKKPPPTAYDSFLLSLIHISLFENCYGSNVSLDDV